MPLDYLTIIPLDQITWENSGGQDDPTSCMLAKMQIGTLMMHLEAIAVEEGADGQNRAVNHHWTDALIAYEEAADARFSTIEINGRDYVLIATPYAR